MAIAWHRAGSLNVGSMVDLAFSAGQILNVRSSGLRSPGNTIRTPTSFLGTTVSLPSRVAALHTPIFQSDSLR